MEGYIFLKFFGFILILVAWGIQLTFLIEHKGKKKELIPEFVVMFGSGLILLMVDSFLGGDFFIVFINMVCFVVVALVLLEIKQETKKHIKKSTRKAPKRKTRKK